MAPTSDGFVGYKGRRLQSILNKKELERALAYLLDENEFLGPHGIRSLSRYHLEHPFVFHVGEQEYKVQYGGIARLQDDPHWRDLELEREEVTTRLATTQVRGEQRARK